MQYVWMTLGVILLVIGTLASDRAPGAGLVALSGAVLMAAERIRQALITRPPAP